MLWLKTCARCSGDLYEDSDSFGRFIACIQCGHELTNREIILLWTASHTRQGPAKSAEAAKVLAFMEQLANQPPPPLVLDDEPRPRRRRRLLLKARA